MSIAVTTLIAATAAANAAAPFTQVLTSAARNLHVPTWQTSHAQVTPGSPAWKITKAVLHGGKQEGVEVITVETPALSFTVVPTRGMSVLSVTAGDVRFGWDSPVKEVVHPKWIQLGSRGGLGWLEGFNEWMVRCGLEWAGHPGRDSFVNNVGERAEMDLTLHGRIGNLPASEVEVIVDRAAPWRIRIRGRVDERMFYGPKLELWTEISVEPGARRFRIADTVTNRGAHEQEMQVIYHANYGAPLLGAGARFRGALTRVTPFNAHAAKSVARFAEYGPPQKGFVEQVYKLHPLAGADGRTTIMLEGARGQRGVSMSFAVAELPYVTLWKNLAATEEGYVTGLEPGTGFPHNRRVERAKGRVPKLAAGAQRSFTIDFEALPDAASVTRAAAAIEALQRGRKTLLDEAPED